MGNIKTMELLFPLVGYSYLPGDRMIARIEEKVKKQEIVENPNDYISTSIKNIHRPRIEGNMSKYY